MLEEAGGAINGTGNDGDNTIIGNSFDNILNGGAGTDALIGGGGNDVLIGGPDADGMAGGAGNDTYEVNSVGDQVVEAANEGNDAVYASVDYGLPSNVEGLVLEDAGGAINGTGNGLDNYLFGNSSANVLDGGAGNDVLSGGGGNDVLIGGSGDDTLTGGVGSDGFAFAPNFGRDTITDFTPSGAAADFIVFDHTIFSNFAAVMAHSYQDGANAVIQEDPGDVVALIGVQLSSLHASNFFFS